MNLAKQLAAYMPQIHAACDRLTKENDPSELLGLLPDVLRAVSEKSAEAEQTEKASFVAHLAVNLCGGQVETCETEDEAIQVARRAVSLATHIVNESIAAVKAGVVKGAGS